jgi:hypothetical protein
VNAQDFANADIRRQWIETRNLQVFTMRDPRNPLLTVDLFAEEPVPFDDLWSRAETVMLGGGEIRVAYPSQRGTMATDSAEWPADFRAAEHQALEASLAATPSQRLAWLEEALAFAYRMGALPDRPTAGRDRQSNRTSGEA